MHFVLGEFEDVHTHTQIQRPHQTVINSDQDTKRPQTSDVPDLVSAHGILRESPYVASGASLVVNFRTGPPFPGTKSFVWTINCEKAEIRVSNERGPFVQMEGSTSDVPIEIYDFNTGKVKTEEWLWEPWLEPLSARGRNTGKLYDLYYEGQLGAAGCADFDAAVERHQQLDRFLYK